MVVHSLVSAPATASLTAWVAIIFSSADFFSSRTPWRTGAVASERSEVRETTEPRSASSAAEMPALSWVTEAATGTSVATGSEEAMPTPTAEAVARTARVPATMVARGRGRALASRLWRRSATALILCC